MHTQKEQENKQENTILVALMLPTRKLS